MKKVLIVEDDIDLSHVVDIILKTHGFLVYTHSTGYDVPQLVRKILPDLVLLDIMLPGKNGIDICKELKQFSTVPVVLFSAHGDKINSLKECNADAFIQKPFEMNKLVSIIKSQILESAPKS